MLKNRRILEKNVYFRSDIPLDSAPKWNSQQTFPPPQVIHDHICYRYEILEVIGKGSFGQVIRALDHKTNQYVAIKIIRNKKRFHHQALVEVRILDELRKKDSDQSHNIIHMLDYFYFRNHLCISFELLRWVNVWHWTWK